METYIPRQMTKERFHYRVESTKRASKVRMKEMQSEISLETENL
jgi:hypothetical protein